MNGSHDPNAASWDIAQAQTPSPTTEQKSVNGKNKNLFARQLAPILSGKRVDEDEERVMGPLDTEEASGAYPAATATDKAKVPASAEAQPPREEGPVPPEESISQPQQEQLPEQRLPEKPSQQQPIQQPEQQQTQAETSPAQAPAPAPAPTQRGPEPEARIQSPQSQKGSIGGKKFSIPGHRHLSSLSSNISNAPGRIAHAPGQIVGGVASGAGTIASGVTRGAGTIASGAGGIAMGAGNLISSFSPFGSKSAKEKAKEEEEIEVRKCYKLHYPLPLRPAEPDQLVQGLQLNALKYLVLAGVVCYISGRIHFGYVFGLISVFAGGLAYWVLGRETQDGLDWQLEKQEGSMTLHSPDGESVEWLNYFLEKIWRSIDPSIFVSVEDILEDTLESIAPAFIKAVKVTDFDIGVHAPRIDMIRIFPPVAGQPEEALFGEASFAFHAKPVGSLSSSHNVTSAPPGIAIRFKTGLKAPIDIKAELTKCTGKLRFKILTAPDFPFVNKVTISFTSVPKIDTGVMPMSKHMNVMRLPMMKTMVNEAVKLGFADLVDPKSMTLNIKEIMGAAALDTSAIGVIKVRVIEAKRDANVTLEDMEDSYATLALSTQKERSASSTRVLTNDKDPRWNEDLFLLIKQEDIINDSMVNIKVWDADKVKFDDEWGCVSVPVKDIVDGKVDKHGNVVNWCKEERIVYDGWAPMDNKPAEESKMQLHFTMSFHPKYIAPPPPGFLNDLQKRSPEQLRLEREPLFPTHKSGILTVTVSEAADLEIGDPEVITSDEFKHPYSPNQVVNPYAVVYLNDHKVYESRPKLRNSSPHWNADSEHLVKDYDTAFLRISVKASLDLERDPVLGTKVFYLSDMFENNDDKFKEVERWVPLQNGIGFGKVFLNLKYKPIKLSLPREQAGSDVCTLVVDRVTFSNLKGNFSTEYMRSTKATLALNIDPVILKRVKAREFKRDDTGLKLWSERRMFFPLTMRYRTAVYVHLSQGAVNTARATGRFWLKNVCDNHWQEITIGLHKPLSEHSKEANRNEDDWPEEGEYGQVKLRIKIVPGFSPVHTHLRSFALDMLGADPFDDETMRLKVEQWMREDESGLDDPLEQHQRAHRERRQSEQEHKQHSPQLEGDDRRESRNTELTDEYGDDMMADRDYLEEMKKYNRPPRIARFEMMRKFVRGTDLLRHRVDSVRSGFNSDMRASRAVNKE